VIILKDISHPTTGIVLFVTEQFKYATGGEGYVAAALVPQLVDPFPFITLEQLQATNEALKDKVLKLKEKGVPIVEHFVDTKNKAIVFVLKEWNPDYLNQILRIVPTDTPVRTEIAS